MTEAVETQTTRESTLSAIHLQLGASMTQRDGWSMPASYGDLAGEYEAVRQRAGLIDLSPRGRLLISGSEAIQFLNGLITNDMKTLAENSWMPAAFPNVQGRLIASVRVAHLPVDGKPIFLIDTEAATHEKVRQTLVRFTLAGDFQVKDLTSETALLSLQGKEAEKILISVLDQESVFAVGAVQKFSWETNGGTAQLTVLRASHTGEDGYDLLVENQHAPSLWNALTDAGAEPFGYDALEVLRIEAGIPRYGLDMDETNIVTETNLDDAVSYTKGCYIGQEIIARIKYRGHVAKKLSGLVFDAAAGIQPGNVVKSVDDKEIGRLTSVTESPGLNKVIALGYLKYDYLMPGTEVKVVTGDRQFSGEVAALPFVARPWRVGPSRSLSHQ